LIQFSSIRQRPLSTLPETSHRTED
jgi:hypothetical protein